MPSLFIKFLALSLIASSHSLFSDDIYVSINGSNSNNGEAPGRTSAYATIAYAVSQMSSGDTCYVQAGTYHEIVDLSSKSGLTITAYGDGPVLMDGTVALSSNWIQHENDIYKLVYTENDPWQLFQNGELMMNARWPNAYLHDDSVWDMEDHWARINSNATTLKTEMVDSATVHSDLSALSFSIQNSIAVLNVGSFKSYTRSVTAHTVGSSTFNVEAVNTLKSKEQFYFLEGKLEFLDSAREWFFDINSNTIYFWAPGGSSPTGDIRVKVQDHAFTGSFCDNIIISGIDFFATTVNFTNSSNIRVESGNFSYPSCTKRMLGVTNTAPITTNFNGGGNNVFYNNTLSYAETHAIFMNGNSNTIDNCRFEYIDWSCADLPNLMGTVYMRGTQPTFRRNYSCWSGASEFLDLNEAPYVELNNISNIGYVQNDGAMIQMSVNVQSGSDVGYNWFHDSFKYGSRFDAVNRAGSTTGSNGLMHHNVGYNIKTTLMFKGDNHRCINNTAFDSGNDGSPGGGANVDIIILDDSVSDSIGTEVYNNVAEKISSQRKFYQAYNAGTIVSHNWNGFEQGNTDIRTLLRDPENLDFRPIPNSVLIDAGKIVTGLTEGYYGSAPDIGAYEHGAENYWIPGPKEARSSVPVPVDATATAKASASLMWLQGLEALSNDVYLGTDYNSVDTATTASSEFVGNQTSNIYDPLGLTAQTYYWRVDTVTTTGTTKGKIWSFTVPTADIIAPKIVNTVADNITSTSATIGGSITDGGTGSKVWVHWWAEGNAASPTIVYVGKHSGSFSIELIGLEENQTYHYQCHAQNNYGSSVAATIASFTAVDTLEWSELLYDDFELGLGNFISGGSNAVLFNDDNPNNLEKLKDIESPEGNNSVQINNDNGVSSSIAYSNGVDVITPGYTTIKVEFTFLPWSMESTDNFFFQYYDGATWITLNDYISGVDFTNGVVQNEEFIFENATHTLSNNFNIRFMCDANGDGDYIYVDTVRLSVLEAASLSPYAQWASDQGLGSADSDLSIDADNDGKNNFLEYALGGDPTDGSDGALFLPTYTLLDDAGTEWMNYVYRRRTDAATRGISYEPKHSTTLDGDSWSATGFTETVTTPIDNDFESVTTRIPVEGIEQLFIQLEIKATG
ncbi:MAG: hypothetical protein VXZ83_02430 [Verrucomicrobiota bacterium]|nr:hypothetical protein [Verrucomicrobiota bacterium]